MQIEEADYSLTTQAFARPGAQPGDETLLVKFYAKPMQNQTKSEEAGRPIFEDKDMVMVRVPGQKDPIVHRVATNIDTSRFSRAYKEYKENQIQEIVEGTPLSEWPAITRSQVDEFRFMNVTTIEQLLGMNDLQAQKFMGIHSLRTKAKAYLEASKTQGAANALIEANRQLEEQKTLNASLSSRLEALESLLSKNVDEPKRRGRPPKDDSERTT